MRISKYIFATTLSFVILLLLGCASAPMSGDKLTEFNAVSVSNDVAVPEKAYYHGPAQTWGGSLFGVAGALATLGPAQSTGMQLAEFMKKENINIGELFIKNLEKQIIETKTFKLVQPGSEKAIFKAKIELYGLSQGNAFGSTLFPQLRVSLQLTKLDGSILWEEKDYISSKNGENDIGDTLENFYKDPNKLRLSFENVSNILAKTFIEGIKQ